MREPYEVHRSHPSSLEQHTYHCHVCLALWSMHDVGQRHLCCNCYIAEGNSPADWHPVCMQAWRELHPEEQTTRDAPVIKLWLNGLFDLAKTNEAYDSASVKYMTTENHPKTDEEALEFLPRHNGMYGDCKGIYEIRRELGDSIEEALLYVYKAALGIPQNK